RADAVSLERLQQRGRLLGGALGERTRLLDEIERAMRGFVRHVDHVREARPGVGNLVLRDVLQARLDAETLESLLQIAGELAQLGKHPRLAHVHDVVHGRKECRLVLGTQSLGESLDAGAVFQLQYRKTRHVEPRFFLPFEKLARLARDVTRARGGPAHLPAFRILSSFSLSVSAVKGLMTYPFTPACAASMICSRLASAVSMSTGRFASLASERTALISSSPGMPGMFQSVMRKSKPPCCSIGSAVLPSSASATFG